MRNLTPDAAALIRAGRSAFRPDASDRDRVLDSLKQTLGEAAVIDQPGPGKVVRDVSIGRPSWRTGKLFGGLAAVSVGVVLVVVAPRLWKTPPRAPTAPVAAPAPQREPAPAAPVDPVATDGDRVSETARSEHAPSPARSAGRPVTRATSDSLREEVLLLSRAERQLSDGLGDDALRTLTEHERRFPRGVLSEERMATRVEALCALGRVAEAKADLARLGRAYPQSAHVDAARRFCGTALDPTP